MNQTNINLLYIHMYIVSLKWRLVRLKEFWKLYVKYNKHINKAIQKELQKQYLKKQ